MSFSYAEPMQVDSREGTWFYHTTELPEHGLIKGHWDLRDTAGAYLGNYDFAGKRALDVGAASGFLTFEMEKRGADVVSFDLDDGANWDVVPHFKIRDQLPAIRKAQSATLEGLKKAYWLSHRSLGSRARAFYGDIYDMPKALGEFDVVFYGMIIGHLRDVFQALYMGARLCSDTMIVTSMYNNSEVATAGFMPSPTDASNYRIKSWWSMNIGTIRAMLGVLGFEVVDIVASEPMCHAEKFEGRQKCTAVVAKRV
ncbi:hypothetical protein BH10PSE7_BH10PSE7_00840 [soil metagenome]